MIGKKVIIAGLILLLTAGVLYNIPHPQPAGEVTVFVIDDFKPDYSLTGGRQASHGEIVKRIISREAPQAAIYSYSVTDNQRISRELYQEKLEEISSYARTNPEKEIIINISLSFFNETAKHKKLIQELADLGVKIVAAAGNNDSDQPIYPAGFESVKAVANANNYGKLANSNYGGYIDIAAPGSEEYISQAYYPGGMGIRALRREGTSFSAPRVAGVWANLANQRPELTLTEVAAAMEKTAKPITSERFEAGQLGAGRLAARQVRYQLLPSYRFRRKSAKTALIGGAFLFSAGILLQYQVVGIFFLLLFGLVIFPLWFLLGEQILMLTDLVIRNDISLPLATSKISFWFLGLGLSFLLTTWDSNKVLLGHLLGLVVSLGVSSGEWLLFLTLGWLLILIIVERTLVVKLSQPSCSEPLKKANKYPSHRIKKAALCNVLSSAYIPVEAVINACFKWQIQPHKLASWWKLAKPPEIEKLISQLIQTDRKKEFIVIILTQLNSSLVVSKLKSQLAGDFSLQKAVLLEVLARLETKAESAIPELTEIISSNQPVNIRYQALQTLAAVTSDLSKVRDLLVELKQTEAGLLRLEAEGLLKDLRNKYQN